MSLGDDEVARIVYLIVLGTILTAYALLANRGGVLTLVRHAILWALLFTGLAAAWGLWQSMAPRLISVQTEETGAIEVRRARDGHFHLTLELVGPPGGRPVPISFIIDTGASDLVLTRRDAQRLGFAPERLVFTGIARTANGITRTAMVRLAEVRIGTATKRNVRALVNDGELHVSLLGMAFLSRFSRIEIAGDRLRIEF